MGEMVSQHAIRVNRISRYMDARFIVECYECKIGHTCSLAVEAGRLHGLDHGSGIGGSDPKFKVSRDRD